MGFALVPKLHPRRDKLAADWRADVTSNTVARMVHLGDGNGPDAKRHNRLLTDGQEIQSIGASMARVFGHQKFVDLLGLSVCSSAMAIALAVSRLFGRLFGSGRRSHFAQAAKLLLGSVTH